MSSQPSNEPTPNQDDVITAYWNANVECTLKCINLLRRLNNASSDMQRRKFASVNWSDVDKLNEINRLLANAVDFAESAIDRAVDQKGEQS